MNCKQITTFTVNGMAYPEICEIPVTKEADEPSHLESGVLNLYPEITFQEIEGFGGAMTESSAYLLSKMDAEKSCIGGLFWRKRKSYSFCAGAHG